MASAMEQAVVTIVNAYERHAGIRGDRYTLSQGELKELLQKELPTWCPTEVQEEGYSKFMSLLDTNKDCQVDFVECMRAIAASASTATSTSRTAPQNPPAPSSL